MFVALSSRQWRDFITPYHRMQKLKRCQLMLFSACRCLFFCFSFVTFSLNHMQPCQHGGFYLPGTKTPIKMLLNLVNFNSKSVQLSPSKIRCRAASSDFTLPLKMDMEIHADPYVFVGSCVLNSVTLLPRKTHDFQAIDIRYSHERGRGTSLTFWHSFAGQLFQKHDICATFFVKQVENDVNPGKKLSEVTHLKTQSSFYFNSWILTTHRMGYLTVFSFMSAQNPNVRGNFRFHANVFWDVVTSAAVLRMSQCASHAW